MTMSKHIGDGFLQKIACSEFSGEFPERSFFNTLDESLDFLIKKGAFGEFNRILKNRIYPQNPYTHISGNRHMTVSQNPLYMFDQQVEVPNVQMSK